MKVIFAQGNPGIKYIHTRHNVGTSLIQAYAASHDATWKESIKFKATIAELSLYGEKVVLVQPSTYYNDTGLSARALVDFYKLKPETDFLVIHDELALPFGTIRVREKGSDAGNNGIKSLNAHIGHNFARIRVGIWSDRHPDISDADYVLGTFSKSESVALKDTITPHITTLIDAFIQGNLVATSQRLGDD